MDQIEKLKQWVSESKRIVFFGGAGVSTESCKLAHRMAIRIAGV